MKSAETWVEFLSTTSLLESISESSEAEELERRQKISSTPFSSPVNPYYTKKGISSRDSRPCVSDPNIDRTDWVFRALRNNPEIAETRERVHPIQRALSFASLYDKGRRHGNMRNEDILSLIFQYLHYEGLGGVIKSFQEELKSEVKVSSTVDVRLITLLRMVIQWTERIWDLSINDKQLDNKKILELIEEQLVEVHMLKDTSIEASVGTSIWDEPREGNIIYQNAAGEEVKSTTYEEGFTVRAASLNKLVEELTPLSNPNNDFVNYFLLTYRSFTSPEILLVKLRQRYDVPRLEEEDDSSFKIRALPVQLRVINFIKLWLENDFTDLSNKFLLELRDFINSRLANDHSGQTKVIQNTLDKKTKLRDNGEDAKIQFIFDSPPPNPFIPKGGKIFKPDLDWMEIDAKEIARQLTLVEFEMLYRIKPSEFLNQSWNKPKLRHRAENLLAYINYFNKLSTWVSTKIIGPTKLKSRIRAWSKFINVSEHLVQLNNFNSLMAILGAFSNAAVNRLKFTKEGVSKEDVERWEVMNELMNSEGGFVNYRKRLEQTVNPCIPYLGIFLTDLTFTEDGNDDEYRGLINFTKRKLVGNIINKIRSYQQTGYNLQPVYQIQRILKALKPRLTEEDQYKLSLLREPRKATRSQIK